MTRPPHPQIREARVETLTMQRNLLQYRRYSCEIRCESGLFGRPSRAPAGPDAIRPQAVFAIQIKGLVFCHGLHAGAGAFCA